MLVLYVYLCYNKKGDVYECYTVFENNSDKTVTLDMISSFAITDIDADTLHRATSFWSEEGKITKNFHTFSGKICYNTYVLKQNENLFDK